MPLKLVGGKLLKVGDALASSDDCCCDDGDCPFVCTGTEPTLDGIILSLTQMGGSGCTCSGSGTYLMAPSGGISNPPLVGCCFCRLDIPLGSCVEKISTQIMCDIEDFPSALPPDVMACCDAFPNTFGGSVSGYEYCCKATFWKYGQWQGEFCVCFNPNNTITYEMLVTGEIGIKYGITQARRNYARDYTYTKQPGSFPGPDCDLCVWSASWNGDWYEVSGSPCPPPDAEYDTSSVCDSRNVRRVFSKNVAIDECCEILNEVTLDIVQDFIDVTLICYIDPVACTDGTETMCANAEQSVFFDNDWGCMPSEVKMQWVGDCGGGGGGPTLSDFFFTDDSDGGINGINNLIWDLGK